MPSTLRFGTKGSEVGKLVKLLTKQGCAPKPPVTSDEPAFGVAIENMVLYFQMTHQGPDGAWLDVDGIVGDGTWWALQNATGDPQRSFLEVGIPKGITGDRRAVLETAVREHGVRECQSRPNRGAAVDRFFPASARNPEDHGPPWCCFYVSWVTKQVFGSLSSRRADRKLSCGLEASQPEGFLGTERR